MDTNLVIVIIYNVFRAFDDAEKYLKQDQRNDPNFFDTVSHLQQLIYNIFNTILPVD
jgi:hypothetical protein